MLREHPLTAKMEFGFAVAGLAAGTLHMIPEFAGAGLLLFVTSVVVFGLLGRLSQSRAPWAARLFEPLLLWSALSLGIAFEFPALLRYPLLKILRDLHARHAYVVLAVAMLAIVVVLGALLARLRGALLYGATAALLVMAGWAVTFVPAGDYSRQAGANSVVMLGIDSLSLADDLTPLHQLSWEQGGVFFDKAVTPGLLTNGVWPAIIMHRPVSQTGVLLTYQLPDWSRSPFNLVSEAKRQGFETWSYFSDQFTTHVGTLGGFDRDRSGPVGWLQMATFSVKDGSVLLPVLLPRLPKIPLARTPPNQASTYAYDLRAEIREMLTAGGGSRPAFVAGHSDYLHQAAYPRFSDLTDEEASAVLAGTVNSLQDWSLHWQYPEAPGEPLKLYDWKVRRIQQVFAEELAATAFLDPAKKNRLALFSDHGNRSGLNNDNFGQPQYYNVPLLVFGVPARDPQAPVSLVDVSTLLGFIDESQPAATPAVVEYANLADEQEWQRAIVTAKREWDGRLIFDPEIISKWQGMLMAYRPYGAPTGYYAAPFNGTARAGAQ